MKKIILLLIAFISLSALAQKREKIKGNKEVLIKTFKLPEFSSVEVGDAFHVELQEATDAATKVKIETDDNLLDVIHFDVEGDMLKITSSKEIVRYKRMNITVYFSESFKAIRAFNKARIFSEDELNIKLLNIEVADRARVKLKLKNTDVLDIHGTEKTMLDIEAKCGIANINLSGSAEIRGEIFGRKMDVNLDEHAAFLMKGNLEKAKINVKNKSRYNGSKLGSKVADAKVYDKADAKINANEDVFLEVSGNSETYIYGTPKIDLKKFKDNAVIYKK